MTDYTKATGSSGTMMIRDTGTYVEFWIKAGSATFAYDMPWGYTVNGTTDTTNKFNFGSGGAYQRVGSWNVTYDQTVTFYLYDTGTSGLGGPTTLSVAIDRSSYPDPPSTPTISSIAATSAVVSFNDGSNNGLAIDSRQISYGTTSAASSFVVASDRSTLITGLAKGTTYYAKARTHNSKGYSAYSAVKSFKTLIEPPAPSAVVLSAIKQAQLHAVFTGNGDGGSAVTEWRIGYGTDPVAPQFYQVGYNMDITGLQPGATYYFWSQGKNAVGYGPLSVRSQATMVAGARITVIVGGLPVVKNAVPFVKVAGVWKVVLPFGKNSGIWRETI